MSFDLGMLVLRAVLGLLMFGHGSQKLFGWFGGAGLDGTTAWLASLGLRPARFWAIVGGVVEFAGGILFALGLLNPIGSLGISASMVMAIAAVHWPRIWVTEGGMEYPLVNLAAATAVALSGPGLYSLDAALGIALPMPLVFLLGWAVVIVGLVVGLVTAQHPVKPEAEEARRAA